MKKIGLLFLLLSAVIIPQSYLGIEGGLEGSSTVDNATINTSAQLNTWTKNYATTTIALETTTVRSGSNSLRIQNSSGTGRRVWAPLMAVSTSSRVVVQYFRRVENITAQESQQGINRNGTETLSGVYANNTASTWAIVTYAPTGTTPTANNLWAVIMTRVPTGGSAGDMFIDDLCVYVATTADATAPNSPGSVTLSNITNSTIDVSWGAASGGVDNGGYLVVRYSSVPQASDDPNQNGIYNVGNTIPGSVSGVVVYFGTNLSFTDSGLNTLTTYYYKVYTYDKAYNYSAESQNSGATLPVELSNFTNVLHGKDVYLIWNTVTEKNSDKFEILRKSSLSDWQAIGSVMAANLSNSPKEYSFIDKNVKPGKYQYRLKMIDNDGTFEYSKVVEAELAAPKDFAIAQNYPNPFNPATTIEYQLPMDASVTLSVYNITGEKITDLVSEEQSAGYYSVNFSSAASGRNIASGVYFYRINAVNKATGNNFSSIKKMIMLK